MNYKWYLKEAKFTKDKGRVFSTFACGGGSTMGYKLAGFDVIGANDIDDKMEKVYKENHNPKHYYLCDIRELNKKIENKEVCKDLYNLDILDGSPPCSTFSISGNREKSWNKEKKFREGQAKQRLDDLFFYFIETARLLQPKIIIAENVKGMILGNAKGYVVQIKQLMELAGYKVQIFLLNAATMGVPQKRERIFIIGSRKDLNFPKLKLEFQEKPILFKEIKDEKGKMLSNNMKKIWLKRKEKDASFADINLREYNKPNLHFNHSFIEDNKVCRTICANNQIVLKNKPLYMSKNENILAGSFPLDYNFLNLKPDYIIGMSVPPLMIAKISQQIYNQWLKS